MARGLRSNRDGLETRQIRAPVTGPAPDTEGPSSGDATLARLQGADDLKAIEALAGTSGLLAKTAANTWALRQIALDAAFEAIASVTNPAGAAGNPTLVLDNQNANEVFAGPASGSPGVPGFRELVAADIPSSPLVVGTTTSTGNQDDFDFSGVDVLRCNNASLLTLRGLSGGSDGQVLRIVSVGSGRVELAHQNANSTAANRLINFATSGNTPLAAGVGTATLVYDGTTSRWRLIGHNQGSWITPTFAAGDYFGASSMTWTVDSGDVTTCKYWLSGTTLFVVVEVANTTVGGTPNSTLQRNIPGGFTSAFQAQKTNPVNNNGTTQHGKNFVTASGTVLNFRNDAGSTSWSAATNTTGVFASLEFEVT